MKYLTEIQKKNLRIKVVKDVLKSLKKYKVERGKFVHSFKDVRNVLLLEDSKEQANLLKTKCEVCALGACFLSTISLTNDFTFKDYQVAIDLEGYEVFDRLREIFSKEQLEQIENAFELGKGFSSSSYYDFDLEDFVVHKNFKSAVNFGKRYKNSKLRLRKIMENILKNKGTFIP